MEKVSLPRSLKVYLPLIALFGLLVFVMPKSPKFQYDYKKGSPWMYETLIAQFDFPILKTEAQLQEERRKLGSSVVPYYIDDPAAVSQTELKLSDIDLGEYASLRSLISETLAEIYADGVISPIYASEAENQDSDGVIYVQKDRRAIKVHLSDVYTADSALAKLRSVVYKAFPSDRADSLFSMPQMQNLIVPNLIYDQSTTDLIHKENIDFISPTSGLVRTGQVVVSNGEIVTAEVEQLLDSYKAEYDQSIGYNGNIAFMWLGNVIVALVLVLMIFLAIFYSDPSVFTKYNKYLYLLMVFTLAAVGSCVVAETNPSLFYLMPFTLVALYLLAFFPRRIVFSVYVVSLLPMLIFAPNGMELLIMYLVAGSVGILVFERFNRGWLQFVTALIVFAVLMLVWSAFRLVEGPGGLKSYHVILNLFLGSMMSVAGYPLIYLFEKVFKLVSNTKLVELSDTSNPLLRKLADKAPGTFQHSLQVMNLADAAARSIGANVSLVRAGALYHDIGKIANPQCFIENESPGVRYHDGLSPKESAQEIIRHVSDGMAMAEKHGLPQVLREFIITHHGTSNTGYFYNTYLNEGGDPDDVADFFYNGMKPLTKEQVILMVSDAVEAASRSLKDYSMENISSLVDKIIDGKAYAGQFSEADISLREINTIKNVLKTYLQQMYHSRVAYPKRKK